MELLTEKQVAELIVEYENKVKVLIEKIKDELQNRKELKKKIEEVKQREALQLQILDRLEESEKLVRKQIDLVAKMEDNESLKQRELIKKYKHMLDEQKSIWQKYKEEYESLASVRKIRQAEAKYMCTSIKHRLVSKKMKEAQRMVQLRELVRKKQEQALVIKFAQLMLDYMKRQKHCRELWDFNRKLTEQVQHLRQQLQEKDNSKKQKLNTELQKASALMKPQKLPQVDLSRFIIHRHKGQDKLDTMSINSYILEEEYINNNGQSSQKLDSSQNKAMDIDTQDIMPMEIDTEEINSQECELVHSKESPRKLDFKGASDNEGKIQSTPLLDECNVGEYNRIFDQAVDSQESHSNANSSRKRINKIQQQNKENMPLNVSIANDGKVQNVQFSTSPRCPIVTSTKENQQHNQLPHQSLQEAYQEQRLSRHPSQETYQQQQVSRQSSQKMCIQQQQTHQQNHHQQEMYLRDEQRSELRQQTQKMEVSPQNSEQLDFSKRSSTNKPVIVSNDYVNYDLQALNYKRSSKFQAPVEPAPQTLSEISTTRSTSAMTKMKSTPVTYQLPFGNGVQQNENITPKTAVIEPSSMMSTTMHSADNSYNFPDNISYILGSEITEPGGSFELARRLYDSDLNSEDGDLDYDKFMRNACSPMQKISPKMQYPQPPENIIAQSPANYSKSQNIQDSSIRAFTFGVFAKKQRKEETTQRTFF